MNEPSVFQTSKLTMPDDTRHRIEEPGFRSRIAFGNSQRLWNGEFARDIRGIAEAESRDQTIRLEDCLLAGNCKLHTIAICYL